MLFWDITCLFGNTIDINLLNVVIWLFHYGEGEKDGRGHLFDDTCITMIMKSTLKTIKMS